MTRRRTETETKNVCPKPSFFFFCKRLQIEDSTIKENLAPEVDIFVDQSTSYSL